MSIKKPSFLDKWRAIDYIDNSDEDSGDEDNWEPVEDFDVHIVSKITNGVTYKKVSDSYRWYEQVPNETEVTLSHIDVIYTSYIKHCLQCSVCKDKEYRQCMLWHATYSHKGGKPCEQCGYIFFSYKHYHRHTCDDTALEILITRNGNPTLTVAKWPKLFSVFVMILRRNGSDTIWIGTTVKISAREGVKDALNRCLTAKRKEKKDKGTKSGNGCTSLMDLLDNKWVPFEDESFFIADLWRGTANTIKCLKFLVRRLLKTPGHHKSRRCEKFFTNYRSRIINILKNDERIPQEFKNNLNLQPQE